MPEAVSAVTAEPGALYVARVMHRRLFPVAYRFVYRVAYLLLDVDRVDDACRGTRLLSHNRFNLFGFYERDFGPGRDAPLRPFVESVLAARGVDLAGGRIRLLCLPRMFGYAFNPISVFYCEHADGRLRAILCQVNNTFGERHYYCLARDGRPMDYAEPHAKDKVFHVSPLIGMDARYRFRFNEPDKRLRLVIREFQDRRLMLVAGLEGRRVRLGDRQLLVRLLRTPLMTFKVMAAIHWQALRIWLHGGRYHRKPDRPRREVS